MDGRAANAAYIRAWRASRVPPPPGDPRHGENCYTNYNCKCDIGRAAMAAKMRRWREKKRAELVEEMERDG